MSGTKIQVHERFRHDCSDFPEEFDQPGNFFPGGGDQEDGLYLVPDEVADYFIRAGWASEPGQEAVKPPQGKPVFVNMHNAKHKIKINE